MRIPLTVMATTAVATTLVGMSVTGCGSHPKSSTPASGSGASTTHAAISDYTTAADQGQRHQSTRCFHCRPGDQRSEWPTRCHDHVH